MKAAYYPQKEEIELVQLETPELEWGEALIKVKYTGICGSDLHVFHGGHPTAKFPIVPGHELVGELVKLGKSTTSDIKPGDTVVVQPFFSCGVCESCITGNDNVCKDLRLLGIHCNGSFAEYVKAPVKKMCRIPNGTDLKIAALAEPLAVAVHDVRRSRLKVGQKALIIGGGPIGMLIAMVANLMGAEVFISEIDEFRLEYAKDMGFKTLNPSDRDFMEQVKEITGGKLFDVVFEVSGSKAGIASATELAKISGSIMIVGMAGGNYPVDLMAIFSKQLVLQGVRIHSHEAFIAAVEILISGKLDDGLHKLVSKVFPLEDVKSAYEYMRTNTDYFKILLEVV